MKINKFLKNSLVLPLTMSLLIGCSQTGQIAVIPPQVTTENHFEYVRIAAEEYLSEKPTAILPEKVYNDYVQDKESEFILVDIRASEDFVAKNIKGSINIPYAQTVNLKKLANLPQDKTLVIIDYNGHWAAQTAATWNMLGFNAIPLLYGMQSWTNDGPSLGYDPFPTEPLNYPLSTEAVTTSQYNLPELMLPQGKVEEIIRALTGTYLDRNYKGYITAADLKAGLDDKSIQNDNYLVDIRESIHYQQGHIQGAANIPYAQLAKEEMLKSLPLDKRIILVGYDGMDASMATRALITLGYDAVALKYGMSYWNGDENLIGISPVRSLIQDKYVLTPLNYIQPSSGPAGCG